MPEKDPELRNIFRIKGQGWQVRVIVDWTHFSKLFSDRVYGSREEALDEAQKYRDYLKNELADEIKEARRQEQKHRYVNATLFSTNTSGIVGVSRSLHKNRSGAAYPYWQASWVELDGSPGRKNASVNKHGEKGALLIALQARLEAMRRIFHEIEDPEITTNAGDLIEKYESMASYLESLDSEEEKMLFGMLLNDKLDSTEKEAIINGRIGHITFRRRVLAYWNHQCCITGSRSLIVAGHIKPWRYSNDTERLDPHNGVALSPTYDKAFDYGLISFADDGQLLVSEALVEDQEKLGIDSSARVTGFTPFHYRYLQYHREHIFQRKDA